MKHKNQAHISIWLTLFIVLGWGLIPNTGASANQACQSYTHVSNISELNAAISCFNGQTSGSHVIQLTQDIRLETTVNLLGVSVPVSQSTTRINNSTSAELTIRGIGIYKINGVDKERPLSIDAGNVTLDGIYIVYGYSSGHAGGIYIASDGNVTLNNSFVIRNNAKWGGGIYNRGTLAINGGQINFNSATETGGGIDNADKLDIDGTSFFENSASHSGGAIYSRADDLSDAKNRNSIVFLKNSLLSENSSYQGGGIYNAGVATVENSDIVKNIATYGGGVFTGGLPGNDFSSKSITRALPNQTGLYLSGFTLRESRVAQNVAEDGGGIIGVRNPRDPASSNSNSDDLIGTIDLFSSVISGNRATTFRGGGIANRSHLTMIESTITDNSAKFGGGGISSLDFLVMKRSTLSGNSTASSGGGVYNTRIARIENSTFTGNSASQAGGGVYNHSLSEELLITHSTFNGNSALKGKAIENEATLVLNNTIIANTDPTPNSLLSCYTGTTETILYSLIEDASCTSGGEEGVVVGVSPNLGLLSDNGGPTLTHALLTGSPAINAGQNASCPDSDQRGEPRNDSLCDMGAYEVQSSQDQAQIVCDPAAVVSTTEELNEAISCFNTQASGTFEITLDTNITLITASTPINNNSSAQLTISGDDVNALNGASTYRVLTIYAGNVTVKDIVLAKGSIDTHGGGIYSTSENLTISNVTFAENVAGGNGAGLMNFGKATVADSRFIGNGANGSGGGLYSNSNGDLTLADNSFTGNTATNGAGVMNWGSLLMSRDTLSTNSASSSGGGLYNAGDGTVILSDNVFNSNTARSGGAILNFGTLIVERGTLNSNSATETGGAAYNATGGDIQFTETTFQSNVATLSGGGLYNNGTATVAFSKIQENTSDFGGGLFNGSETGSLTVLDSDFVVNTGAEAGGGIYNQATLDVHHSSFFGNNGGDPLGPADIGFGGGIFNGITSTAKINNSTLSNNYAGDLGGGLFTDVDANITVINSTLADNIANNGASIWNQGTTTFSNSILAYGEAISECVGDPTFTTSLVEDGSCSVVNGVDGNLTGDPLLGPKTASKNGGPTSTRTLLGGSKAIGAGDNAVCSTEPINGLDQRGVIRDANCDMGAYEFNNDAVIVSWSTAETTVDEDAGTISLTVKLHKAAAGTVTVDYTTNNGTATENNDFGEESSTLTFGAGETEQTVDISIENDSSGESAEYFPVTLSNPTNAELGNPKQIRVEIIDDDQPSVSLAAASQSVSETGGNLTLTIELNRASEETVTVGYRTYGQTATEDTDYTDTAGTLTFNPGETSKMVQIPISEDSDEEVNETFVFELISPTNSGLGTNRLSTITINDNDSTASSGFKIFLPLIVR